MRRRWILRAAKIGFFVALAIAGLGFLLMVLWNVLIPDIFINGPRITFVQSLGLLLLSRILFMGFRPWGWGYGYGKRGEHWRKKFEEKLASMPAEEREKIKQAYARRCGWYREQAQPAPEQNTATPQL